MVSLNDWEFASLQFFVDDRFQRDVDNLTQRNDDSAEGTVTRLSFLESFLWLYTGTQYGFFPGVEANKVATKYRDQLQASHERAVKEKTIQQFEESLQRILGSAVSLGEPLLQYPTREVLESVPKQRGAFRDALLVCNDFARNSATSRLLQGLAFERPSGWEQQVAGLSDFARTDRAQVGDDEKEYLIRGFVETIQYMEILNGLFEDLPKIGMSHLVAARIRDLLHWRLNFNNKVVLDRFIRLVSELRPVLVRSLAAAPDVPIESVDRAINDLVPRIGGLMSKWGEPPIGRGTSAG
jgi:hypothetical protein